MLREIEPAARQTPCLGLLFGRLLLLLGRLLLLLLLVLVLVGAGRGGRRADGGGRRRGLGGQSLEDGVHLVRHGLQVEVTESEIFSKAIEIFPIFFGKFSALCTHFVPLFLFVYLCSETWETVTRNVSKKIHLFGEFRRAYLQAELELLLGLHHAGALVADVLQRGGDVDLLGALRHAVQHHVDEAVGAGAAGAVTAVHHDGARAAAVRLVHLPAMHTTRERGHKLVGTTS